MTYKQIGAILNDVFSDVIGADEFSVAEDLSNIVELGHKLEETSAFSNNFDNYVKTLVDRVGKVYFRENDLSQTHLPIWKDSWEFGSVAEKIRVEAPDVAIEIIFDFCSLFLAFFSSSSIFL